MQKKKKKWLIITGIVLAVLALVLFLIFYSVNSIFSLVSDSFYQSGIVITESGNASSGGEAGQGSTPDGAVVSPSGTSSGSTDRASQQPAGTETASGAREIPFDKLNLTMEEFKALQQQVPFNDKVAALSILSAGLSASDYTELFSMLSGGITSDEVKRAYKIVSRGLSSEDKAKIWGYYDKYKYLIQ